jgi:hypothetical protein
MPTSNIRVGAGGPSVAIDTQNSALIADSGNTVSVTLTVANQSNRALVALIDNSQSRTVSGVTYTAGSGGAWTQLGTVLNPGAGVELEIWTSTAPSAGSITVQATLSSNLGGGADAVMQLYSLYNVDQTTPADGYASAQSTETLDVSSSASAMALCSLCSVSNPDPIISGTNDLSNNSNIFWRAAHFQTGPTATFTWTAATPRAINGCNVRKA